MADVNLVEHEPDGYIIPPFPMTSENLYKHFTIPVVGKYIEFNLDRGHLEFVVGVKGTSDNFGKEQRLVGGVTGWTRQRSVVAYKAFTGKEKIPKRKIGNRFFPNVDIMNIRGCEALGVFVYTYSYNRDGRVFTTILERIVPVGTIVAT